jgi:YD repeat-containing protein
MKPISYIASLLYFTIICLGTVYGEYGLESNGGFHPQVIPPAPTASSLGQYGNIPVNLSSGIQNPNIPLYTLKYKNASIPVSLSYLCNGIKVDEVSPWAGMGWSILCGGVITRTVKDGDDEESRYPIPDCLDQYSPETVDYLKYHWDHTTDLEPDIFNYNFNGFSGKFILNRESDGLKIYSIPSNNLLFNVIIGNDNGNDHDYRIFSFTITTPDGISYLFGENFFDETKDWGTPSDCFPRIYQRPVKTSWHLKSIVYPTGETIMFEYKKIQLNYYAGVSQTIRMLTAGECWDCSEGSEYICGTHLETDTWYLTRIYTADHPNEQEIKFYSNRGRLDIEDVKLDSIVICNSIHQIIKKIQFQYFFSNSLPVGNFSGFSIEQDSHRMFLSSCIVKGKTSVEPQIYSFEYYTPDNLPPRLSFSQDHWGYYNGINNHDFVVPPPELSNNYFFGRILNTDRKAHTNMALSGLLKRITYPTSGSSSFEYEQNGVDKMVLQLPDPIVINGEVIGTRCVDAVTMEFPFSIPATYPSQDNNLFCWVEFTQQSCDFHKNDHVGLFKLLDVTTTPNTTIIPKTRIFRNVPLSRAVHYEPGHSYVAIVTSHGDGLETSFQTQYYDTEPVAVHQTQPIGGMRIRQIVDVDPLIGKTQITRYYYGDLSGNNLNNLTISSGVTNGNPRYDEPQFTEMWCDPHDGNTPQVLPCGYLMLHSNSISNLYGVGGSNIMYRSVIVSHGENFENGGELNEFLVEVDEPGEIVQWSTNNILGATKTNFSWNNGRLNHHLVFKVHSNTIIPVKETINTFYEDPRKDKVVYGYVIRKNYDPILNVPWAYTCTKADAENTPIMCFASHQHQWALLGNTICIAPGADNQEQRNECTGHEGLFLPNSAALDNIDGIKYGIISKWEYLSESQTKSYDTNGQNSVTENITYIYNNPNHALVNISERQDSQGNIEKDYFYYPQDYSSSEFQSLINKHIINLAIDSRKTKNNYLVSGKISKFNNLGQIIEYDIAREELGTSNPTFDPSSPYSYGTKEAEFNYDALTNNLRTIVPTNNFSTIYLWGYNASYPVIEISNSTFSIVSAKLQQGGFDILSLENSFNDSYFIAAADYLRQNLKETLVKSYTYDPQIGVTSITDEAGIITRYEYNSNSQLSFIKDNQGHIMKQFDYHYSSNH